METTIFLAKLWGPVLVSIGAGFFISRSYYASIYRDLEKAPFAVLFFGMVAMAGGIAQLTFHNSWTSIPEIIVTLLGWGLLMKGVVCVVVPRLADRGGDWVLDTKILSIVGLVTLLIGLYLSWFAYFA